MRIAAVLPLLVLFTPACAPIRPQVSPQAARPGRTSQEEPIDADRPHVGTGTHLVTPGSVQVEVGGQYQGGHDERTFASPVLIRLGLIERIEARIASDGIVGRRGTEQAQGIGNTQLSAKVRLAGGPAAPILSVMPVVTFGTASVSKGLGAGSTDAQVVLLAGREVREGLHLEANYGAGFIGSGPRGRRASQQLATGAAVYSVTRNLAAYGEGVWWSRQQVGGTAVSFTDVGVIYTVRPHLLLDAGAVFGISDAAPVHGVFAGASFLARARGSARIAPRMPHIGGRRVRR